MCKIYECLNCDNEINPIKYETTNWIVVNNEVFCSPDCYVDHLKKLKSAQTLDEYLDLE